MGNTHTPTTDERADITEVSDDEAARSSERRSPRRRSQGAEQHLSTALLALLLIGAPQLLGGLLPWTALVIAWASVACLAVLATRAPAASRRFPPLGIMLLALCAWTALQVLPLPCDLVAWLAPHSAEATRAVDKLLHESASVCTLTLSPGATRLELVKILSIFATFSACWFFAASGGRRRLLKIIAISALAMSVVALGHALFQLDSVFGLYKPPMERPFLLAPLLNSNNLGGFAAMGVPLWIGLTYRAQRRERWLGYAAIALTTTTAVLSLSRGAIGQLLLSCVVMTWIIYRHTRRAPRSSQLPLRELGLGLAGAAGLAFAAHFVGQEVMRDFRESNFDKLELIAKAAQFTWQHALTGVGRGAFASAFVAFEGAHVRFRYVESCLMQWAADWGIPIVVCLVVVIAFELMRSRKHQRWSLGRMGAYTALLTWGAQNLVDFAFELSGIAVVAAGLLAACVAPSTDAFLAEPEEPNPLRRGNVLALAAVCVSSLCFGLLGSRVQNESVHALQNGLRQAMRTSDRALFARRLQKALRAHPVEPVVPLMAASEAAAHRDPKTSAWINRSMVLAPGWARPHHFAYRWLWQHGQGKQALLELKAAANIDAQMALEDACKLGRVNAEWPIAIAPEGAKRRAFFDEVSLCLHPLSEGAKFDAAMLREFPGARIPWLHTANRALTAGDTEEGLAILERLHRAHPDYQVATVTRLQALLASNRLQELLDELERDLPRLDVAHQVEVLGVKAFALARLGSPQLMQETLAEIRKRATNNPRRLAHSYELEGRIHNELRQPGAAFAAFREAFRISNDTGHLRSVALMAEALGDHAQALWAYINLCQREPLGDSCARRNALLAPRREN